MFHSEAVVPGSNTVPMIIIAHDAYLLQMQTNCKADRITLTPKSFFLVFL